MKRSTFIYYTLVGSAVAAIPAFRCSSNDNYLQVLGKPQFLSHICDAVTINEIGRNYQNNFPEKNREQLIRNLMKEGNGKTFSKNTSDSAIASFLAIKVKSDFETGRTVVIKGWILSETEAQQCALFSLTQPKL